MAISGVDRGHDVGGGGGAERVSAAYGQQEDVDVLEFFHRGRGGGEAEVANLDAVELEDEHHVAVAVGALGGDAGDENAAFFVFAGRIEEERIVVDDSAVVVAGIVGAADGDDVGLLLGEAVTAIGRAGVGEHDTVAALEAEAGAAKPGNFDRHGPIVAVRGRMRNKPIRRVSNSCGGWGGGITTEDTEGHRDLFGGRGFVGTSVSSCASGGGVALRFG